MTRVPSYDDFDDLQGKHNGLLALVRELEERVENLENLEGETGFLPTFRHNVCERINNLEHATRGLDDFRQNIVTSVDRTDTELRELKEDLKTKDSDLLGGATIPKAVRLELQLGAALLILEDVWMQFSYEHPNGIRHAGGLSTLENVEGLLRKHGRMPKDSRRCEACEDVETQCGDHQGYRG